MDTQLEVGTEVGQVLPNTDARVIRSLSRKTGNARVTVQNASLRLIAAAHAAHDLSGNVAGVGTQIQKALRIAESLAVASTKLEKAEVALEEVDEKLERQGGFGKIADAKADNGKQMFTLANDGAGHVLSQADGRAVFGLFGGGLDSGMDLPKAAAFAVMMRLKNIPLTSGEYTLGKVVHSKDDDGKPVTKVYRKNVRFTQDETFAWTVTYLGNPDKVTASGIERAMPEMPAALV